MNNKLVISSVLVIMIVLLGLSIYKSKQGNEEFSNERQTAIKEEVQRPTETISAKYQYKNGQNVFVVMLELPTPCHTYSHALTKNGDIYEISLSTKPSQEVCAQVITERLVKIQWTGNEDDSYIAKLNGEVVNLNVFTIPESENIDDIEIYTKG